MNRYARLEILDEIGPEGVERLRVANVLVIGCGALGSLAAMYLAASGVGHITIADFDTIDITNLQRQLFFTEDELGESKSETLARKMRAINSEVNVSVIRRLVTPAMAKEIFDSYDFIIDGSDNGRTKMMTSEVAAAIGVPCCIGGVNAFSGQVISWRSGCTKYTDIFGENVGCDGILPCEVKGVLGPAAGVVASVQASEAIKHLTGVGEMLYDRLFIFDLKMMNCNVIRVGGAR